MSLPRQAPIHASSSSSPPPSSPPRKASLRRPGSGASLQSPPPTQPRGLLPSPHFADDPAAATHPIDAGVEYSEHAVGDGDGDGDDDSYNQDHGGDHEHNLDHDHDDADAPPPLPDSFQPFFTLVQDTVTNQHFHPTVHYIFADDDSDLISEAACRSLEILDPSQQVPPSKTGQSIPQDHVSDNGLDEHGHLSPRLPPTIPGVREHYLILDVLPHSAPLPLIPPQQQSLLQLHTQGAQQSQSIQPSSSPAPTSTTAPPFTISKATSLSAEWQVLRTNLTTAPTIGDDDQDDGLMLVIQGRGNTPAGLSAAGLSGPNPADKAKERDADKDRESMEDLIEQFQRRMDETKQILDAVDGTIDE